MGVMIVVFSVIVLLILIFNLYNRCLRNSYSTSSLSGVHALRAPIYPPPRQSHVDTGLDKATIAQLPTFIYRKQETTGKSPQMGEKNKALLDCAICLSKFQDNEEGRFLPSCKHAFHIECIDMWFCSHSTCPLCRIDVVPVEGDERSPQTPKEATGLSQQNKGTMAIQSEPGSDVLSQSPKIDIFDCNQTQVAACSSSAKDPSCLHLPSISSSLGPLTHVSIDVPISQGSVIPCPAPYVDQEDCSLHHMRSLSFRLFFK
ncbi:hypothetical protein L7F22_020158 [Adiantum nelumboides]|nr:hypothetical protein [Adiantum nelumboides]